MTNLAAYIRQRMDTLGIETVEELARRTGMARSHVGYYLDNTGAMPREPTVAKLAAGLQVDPDRIREAAGLRVERIDDGLDPGVEALLLTVRDMSPEEREQWMRWSKFAVEQIEAERARRDDQGKDRTT